MSLNKEAVADALAAVLATIPSEPLLAFVDTGTAEAEHNLVRTLREQMSLSLFDGYTQVFGGGGCTASFEALAQWLVRRAVETEPRVAVDDVDRYVGSTTIPSQYVVAVSGVAPTGVVDLGLGLKLLPWSELPETLQKKMVVPHLGGGLNGYPSSALVWAVDAPVSHTKPGMTQQVGLPDLALMHDALACISATVPTSVAALCAWLETPAWVPRFSSWMMWPSSEGHLDRHVLTMTETSRAIELLLALRRLGRRPVARLRLILQRIGLSMRRRNLADAALDLGVALELIFLSDLGPERGETTFRLRLRAARFLERELHERRKIFALVGAIYKMRSSAAHDGAVPSEVDGRSASEILNEGTAIAARATRMMVLNGVPDWTQVQLG